MDGAEVDPVEVARLDGHAPGERRRTPMKVSIIPGPAGPDQAAPFRLWKYSLQITVATRLWANGRSRRV